MADAVADPAPSPSAPVIDPAAAPAVVDPAKPLDVAPDAKALADKATADAAAAKPVIPEKYDFAALKLPDGIALNPELIEAISPVFKKYGLTQEAASELVETHAKALATAEAAAEVKREADFKEWMKTNITNYQTQLKSEWGSAHDANVVIAQKGMARVFSAEAKKLLDDTGLGNHPEFVKAFYQVGKMVSEDNPPNGQKPAGTKSNAEVFYGATATQ